MKICPICQKKFDSKHFCCSKECSKRFREESRKRFNHVDSVEETIMGWHERQSIEEKTD